MSRSEFTPKPSLGEDFSGPSSHAKFPQAEGPEERSDEGLRDLDSNQDKQIQSLLSYH